MTHVNVKCTNCEQKFEKELRRFNESNIKGWKHFCSLKCKGEFQTTSIEVQCGQCGMVITKIPAHIKKSKSGLVFCNKSCSTSYNNTVCRTGEDHPHFKRALINGKNTSGHYRLICFKYHEKKCVVCEEKNIVTVHHFDENHENNDPSNLIPLCPTHHQYWHSRYKNLIESKVLEYREQFLESAPLLERYTMEDTEF